MDSWIDKQVEFWYGGSYGIGGDAIAKLLLASRYGQNINSYLSTDDITYEQVKAKYGTFGEYRFKWAADVVQDIVKHDTSGRLSKGAAQLPVLLVDSIGPWLPVIGYNRIISENTRAVLWPLHYHHDLAVKGLDDRITFANKIPKTVFRGALSGPLMHTEHPPKTSRLQVVRLWAHEDESDWLDIGISLIPQAHVMLNGLIHTKPAIDLMQLLMHKYVVCIEGADISSGLGTVLASHALPLCPYPFTYEVWYFNGLEPYVHFVPLAPDCADLKEKYIWCEQHPEECAAMSANGRRHMEAMLDPENLRKIKEAVVSLWPIF